MGWLGISLGLCQPRHTGGGTPTAPDAPTLTRLSTAGSNPLEWSIDWGAANLTPDASDYLCQRWNVDGGAWTSETEYLFTSADYYTFVSDGSFPVPKALYNAATFAPGAVVTVEAGIHRGAQSIVWSAPLSDTMAAVRWAWNAAPAPFHAEFSSPDPVDFTGQSFGAGTAIVWLSTRDNPPASVTYNGAAMTLERSLTDGNHSLRLYKKTGVSADANVTITVTPSGPSKRDYGIATGTLASSINHVSVDFKTLAVGFGADPQTTPTFTLPANGVALACVGNIGNGVVTTWGSGTANTERHGANGDFAFGTASMLGGASDATGQTFAANGFDHSGAGIIAVIFGP